MPLHEPSTIIDMAERVRITARRIIDMKDVAMDIRDRTKGTLEALSQAQFYDTRAILGAVDEMFEAMFQGRDAYDMKIDEDCRLPSDVCAFWAPGTKIMVNQAKEPLPFLYLAARGEKPEETYVFVASPYMAPMPMGLYTVGQKGGVFVEEQGSEEQVEQKVVHTLTVAAVCSIINQPSYTLRLPAGSRQERRAAQRGGNYQDDAWHRIEWNVGTKVRVALETDADPSRRMPLHYTRGYWRRGQEGWTNATQRRDGLWYQWINGYWSGHPAFGIRKTYHAPKEGDAA